MDTERTGRRTYAVLGSSAGPPGWHSAARRLGGSAGLSRVEDGAVLEVRLRE